MMRQFILLALLFSWIFTSAQEENKKDQKKEKNNQVSDEWTTYYEKSGFIETPRYDETIEYCKKLAKASEYVHYTNFGKSPEGRDLPLLIISKTGYHTFKEVKQTNNLVVMIMAGIHAGEIDGKDAGLMLIRDMVINKKQFRLLDNVTILFIPIFNVDGHEHFGQYNRINQNGPKEMGWRTNAMNLNLNRDFLKADAPETQAWLNLFVDWLPDFFIDIHATDGADYQYQTTYGLEIYGNMTEELSRWQLDMLIPFLHRTMSKSDMDICRYVAFRDWHDPESGLRSWVSPPRLSTGYTALQNRPGLLIENHMLKDYKTRVNATYLMLVNTLIFLNNNAQDLSYYVLEADKLTSSQEFRNNEMPLDFQFSNDSMMVEFKGFEYEIQESDLTGGKWVQYSDKPKTYDLPFFSKMDVTAEAKLPEFYVIPAGWYEVIKRLELHGVFVDRLLEETTLTVETYKFNKVEWAKAPYEGRFRVVDFDYDVVEKEITYPKGTAIVDLNQPTAKIAAHILEPLAPDSYLRWGFFNTVFEQKEYGESYVMEKMARDMIKKDPDLKKEYEQKKKDDESFAKSPRAQLNWFYQHTPYWDERVNVYPVTRVVKESEVQKLL
jgi:hypothetical protein